jgi:hypothetical protein
VERPVWELAVDDMLAGNAGRAGPASADDPGPRPR